jgi:hypothetical protein
MHGVLVRHSYRSLVLGPAARDFGLGLQRRANHHTNDRNLCNGWPRPHAAGTADPTIAQCSLQGDWGERRNLPVFRGQRDRQRGRREPGHVLLRGASAGGRRPRRLKRSSAIVHIAL